ENLLACDRPLVDVRLRVGHGGRDLLPEQAALLVLGVDHELPRVDAGNVVRLDEAGLADGKADDDVVGRLRPPRRACRVPDCQGGERQTDPRGPDAGCSHGVLRWSSTVAASTTTAPWWKGGNDT